MYRRSYKIDGLIKERRNEEMEGWRNGGIKK